TGRELRTGKGGLAAPVGGLAFSGDGKSIGALCLDGSLHVFDASNGKEIGSALVNPNADRAMTHVDIAPTPDGRGFAVTGADNALHVIDAEGKESRVYATGGPTGFSGAAVARDGRLVAAAGYDQTLRLFESATGREVRSIPTGKVAQAVK